MSIFTPTLRPAAAFAVAGLAVVGLAGYNPKHAAPAPSHAPSSSTSTTSSTSTSTTTSTTVITEDDPRWDCETMGNRVCGAVNVEVYTEGAHQWVRVWDERNRLVFGPVYVEGMES